MKNNTINIEEIKQIKKTFQIHLSHFTKKYNKLLAMDDKSKEFLQLKCYYSFCIDTLDDIVEIYADLINLFKKDELKKDYFQKKIQEAQRLHKNINIETNKPTTKRLLNIYNIDIYSKKGDLTL